MIYKILFSISVILLVIDCSSTPVSLKTAPRKIEDDQKTRSAGNYPQDAKPGRCYTKTSVPAEYKTVTEQVLVTPASSSVQEVAAVVETVDEQVVDKPGSTFWKKSDDGDLYCFEEIPPTYKTVKKEVVKTPAGSRVVETPAEYKTVSKQELVKEEQVEWTEVLCGNNARPEIIAKIQKSLKSKGYSTGNTDGKLEQDTMDSISKYQKDNKLKVNKNGLINMETVESLGVKL